MQSREQSNKGNFFFVSRHVCSPHILGWNIGHYFLQPASQHPSKLGSAYSLDDSRQLRHHGRDKISPMEYGNNLDSIS